MKLGDIKETITGLNNLGCMVELQVRDSKVFFIDDTRWTFTEVDTQEKLDNILKENTFTL